MGRYHGIYNNRERASDRRHREPTVTARTGVYVDNAMEIKLLKNADDNIEKSIEQFGSSAIGGDITETEVEPVEAGDVQFRQRV